MDIIKSILPCAILSLFAFNLKAQSEYIVTLQSDTIKGEVKNYFEDVVKFIPEGSTERVRYKATEIKAFHVVKIRKNPTDCEAVKLPGTKKTVFVHRLMSGKITLYELIETAVSYSGVASSSVTWYVKKQDQDIIEIKTSKLSFNRKEREDAFFVLLKDNPKVAEQYQNGGKFSFDFIKSIINAYNQS
ncbi:MULTISPECIES: hypothetical protein [unclassified Pedobacter]|uniref:hypothetical protein n=1 Tax=unclassified Pedobacter TaxID=2628915 RepID=UPI00141E4851|nr:MULTISPECIES: hypothetical protein [unclassified Pedobacter]NII83451.1 hypothetical protein [Pedobacter sp. SG908]NMN37316.1 hypothetical protein [Pedobacter sp. SG918]